MRIGVQMRRHIGILTVLLAISIASPGGSSSPAGTAIGVIPDAQGTIDGQSAAMAAGDGVFLGQNVITGNVGQVQIVFSDDTHLVVGPQASLIISEYLMRNDGTASKFVVDALGGTFRFMTGNSPKNAYAIKTPTGTLGVRGTVFDFTIDPQTGKTTVLLYHGGVSMCGAGGCSELSEACAVGVIAKHAAATVVGSHDKRRPPMLQDFPYLNSQQTLKSAFRVKQTAPCKTDKVLSAETKVRPASSEPPASEPPSSAPSSEQPASAPPSHEPSSSEPSSQPSSRPPSSDPSSSSTPPTSSSSVPPSSTPREENGHDNNGLGNGGDTPTEGDTETGNQGNANGGSGNGTGNGSGNGGVGNGNGVGNAKH